MKKAQYQLFLYHIPKTAGTSIRSFFVEHFGADQVSPNLKGVSPEVAWKQYSKQKVVIGHFDFYPGQDLPMGYLNGVLLRNPLERALSHYYYYLENTPAVVLRKNERLFHEMSLMELLERPASTTGMIFSNYQARHLASRLNYDQAELEPQALLELAKKSLLEYDLVGTTEKMGDFLDWVCSVLEIDRSIRPKTANVTSRKVPFAEQPPEIQVRLQELNAVDLELWEFAQQLGKDRRSIVFEPRATTSIRRRSRSRDLVVNRKNSPAKVESGFVEFVSASIRNPRDRSSDFLSGELVSVVVVFRALATFDDLIFGLRIESSEGMKVFGTNTSQMGVKLDRVSGNCEVVFEFPGNLGLGTYTVTVGCQERSESVSRQYFWEPRAASFTIVGFLDREFEGPAGLAPVCRLSGMGEVRHLSIVGGFPRVIRYQTPTVVDARGVVRCTETSMKVRLGEQVIVPVEITNDSLDDWSGIGTNPVSLSYHWLGETRDVLVFDGVRSALPARVIRQGTTVCATAVVEAPTKSGLYILEISLVQDGVAWLEDRGLIPARIRATVES